MSAETPPSSDRPTERTAVLARCSRYDLVLGLVPVAFVLGLLATGVAGVPIRISLAGAAGVGALAMIDALFLNPPRRPRVGTA